MNQETISVLRDVNQKMRPELDSWAAEGALDLGRASRLFHEMQRGSSCLRDLAQPQADASAQEAIGEFQGYIQVIQGRLPAISALLLTEKMQLEQQRVHLAAAASWMKGRKDVR
jgi:hypothetical protein